MSVRYNTLHLKAIKESIWVYTWIESTVYSSIENVYTSTENGVYASIKNAVYTSVQNFVHFVVSGCVIEFSWVSKRIFFARRW